MKRDPFESWMQKVDAILRDVVGMESADLPDFNYRALFEGKYSPAKAAQHVRARL